jgi:hypothetical protein
MAYFFKDFGKATAGMSISLCIPQLHYFVELRSEPSRVVNAPPDSPDLFNDDFSYKRKLKIKLPTPNGVVS